MPQKRWISWLVCLICLGWLLPVCPVSAAATNEPILNQGEKWRLAYYEGGPYSDYVKTMHTLLQGLMDLRWLKPGRLPQVDGDAPKPYWKWLRQQSHPYFSIKPQNAYSADWDDKKRQKIKKILLDKLKRGQLDLVIAMGTWAGQDLANNLHTVPTMVLSTSDPVKAGIIKSAEDPGLDHVTARVDPDRLSAAAAHVSPHRAL